MSRRGSRSRGATGARRARPGSRPARSGHRPASGRRRTDPGAVPVASRCAQPRVPLMPDSGGREVGRSRQELDRELRDTKVRLARLDAAERLELLMEEARSPPGTALTCPGRHTTRGRRSSVSGPTQMMTRSPSCQCDTAGQPLFPSFGNPGRGTQNMGNINNRPVGARRHLRGVSANRLIAGNEPSDVHFLYGVVNRG